MFPLPSTTSERRWDTQKGVRPRVVPVKPPFHPAVFFAQRLTFAPCPAVAGALEALCAMAHAHLELGVASPFLVSAADSP